MAIETEVKFRMEKAAWTAIKADYERDHTVDHIEEQTNQYYHDTKGQINERRIGLRLRRMPDKCVLTIKGDSADGIKREEIEETYPAATDSLPPDSPALQALLARVGIAYEDLVPQVMMTTRRTVFQLQEGGFAAAVCFDDVSILDTCREHKLFEIEFELVSGDESRLFEIVDAFHRRYGEQVERSGVSKLAYALNLVSCRE